jgi:hypothetical protein
MPILKDICLLRQISVKLSIESAETGLVSVVAKESTRNLNQHCLTVELEYHRRTDFWLVCCRPPRTSEVILPTSRWLAVST